MRKSEKKGGQHDLPFYWLLYQFINSLVRYTGIFQMTGILKNCNTDAAFAFVTCK
jgi:hypothetical protein